MANSTIIAIVVLAVVLILAAMVFMLYQTRKNKNKKAQGPETATGPVVAATKSFARRNEYRFFGPAVYEGKNSTARLDGLVVGYFGVLGVKAYGYNGEIYGAAKDKEWLQVTEDGTRNYFANPIIEAAADVRVLRDALIKAGQRTVPVEVLVVFSRKEAQLALPRGTGQLTLKEFKAQLRKDKYTEDKGIDLDKVQAAFDKTRQQG